MPGEIMISKRIPSKMWRKKKKKQAFHGVLMGIDSSACLHSDVVVQISEIYHDFQHNLMTRRHLESCCRSLMKKKIQRRVINILAAMAVAVGTNLDNSPRKRLYSAGNLPEIIILQSMHDGKIFSKRSLLRYIRGLKLNSRPSYILEENHPSSREAEALPFREIKSCAIQGSEEFARNDSASFKDGNGCKEKVSLKSISVIRRELPESTLGWPLLPRTTPLTTEELRRRRKARSMSLIEWVMSLPTRSSETIMGNQTDTDSVEANISMDCKTEDSVIDNEGTRVEGIHSSENKSIDGRNNREDEESGLVQEIASSSFSVFTEDSTQFTLGWPLLRMKTLDSLGESEMSLTNQSTQATPKSQINLHTKEGFEGQGNLTIKLDIVLKLKSSGCKQFSYEELERATHKFSSENLIGEGGCSIVYKGSIARGKLMAVKVLKEYKEAWNDFSLELDIMSSLKHKHITRLIGVCIDDNHLILVYDFLSKGSLEERLKGHNQKSILPWKMRFKVAIAVADALNYLHNGCSHPVIHRDVKSSNILLSDDFKPQLSDFGLATWGPEDTAYIISSGIVGTFGYIAPEYFMYGRVSDKIDIYSFGIVLLELLTGKKPISSKGIEGQESLAMWAMPLIENGNLEALVDPMLGGEFDNVQMQRMVLAATLCIKQSPRLRPKASQIVKLLRVEKEVREWMNDYVKHLEESSYEEMDDLFPEFNDRQNSDSSFLVLEDDASSQNSGDTDTTTLRSSEKSHCTLKDCLKERQH